MKLLIAEPSWDQSNFTKRSNTRKNTLKIQVGSESGGKRCEGIGVCVSIISWGKGVPAQVMGTHIIDSFPLSSQQLKVALSILILLLQSSCLGILLHVATVK